MPVGGGGNILLCEFSYRAYFVFKGIYIIRNEEQFENAQGLK